MAKNKNNNSNGVSPASFWATQMGHKDQSSNTTEWDNDSWATQRG